MKKRAEHAGLRAGTLLASCLFLMLAVGWICADTLCGASLCGGLTGRGVARGKAPCIRKLKISPFPSGGRVLFERGSGGWGRRFDQKPG